MNGTFSYICYVKYIGNYAGYVTSKKLSEKYT